MSRGFPENPSQRKVLVVLSEDDLNHCEYDNDGRRLLTNPEVAVQKFPVETENKTLVQLEREGTLRPGATLLQSPYDPEIYVEMAEAEDSFAVEKYMLSSTVCMLLGAKEVRVQQIVVQDSEGETSVDVGADRLGAKGKVSVGNEHAKKLQSRISLRDEFEGGDPNPEAAEALMRKACLMRNPNLRSLLEMAKVGNNRLKSRSFEVDLSREARKRLEVVAGVGVPGVLGVDADFEQKYRESVRYRVSIEVTF